MPAGLKILQVIHVAVYGGLSLHVLTLSEELALRGHALSVLSMREGPLLPEFPKVGVPVSVIPFFGPGNRRNPLATVRAIAKLSRIIRQTAPDVIHTHGPRAHFAAGVAARMAGRPVLVASIHGSYKQFIAGGDVALKGYKRTLRKFVFGSVDRLMARFSDRLIAVCKSTRDDLVNDLKISAGRVTVVHNGIKDQPVSVDRVLAIRRELGVDASDLLVAYVGRIAVHKGSQDLMEAIPAVLGQVPRAKFLIVGTGPMQAAVKQFSVDRHLEDRVIVTGSRPDAIALIAASDILVLPSLSEGLPLTTLEAAMCGKPMVATNVGGIPEVVKQGETGLLVDVNDPQALSAAIVGILEDDEVRMKMGVAARTLWEREFTAGMMVRRMESLYEEVLAARRS